MGDAGPRRFMLTPQDVGHDRTVSSEPHSGRSLQNNARVRHPRSTRRYSGELYLGLVFLQRAYILGPAVQALRTPATEIQTVMIRFETVPLYTSVKSP